MPNPGVEYDINTKIKRNLVSKYFVHGWWTDEHDKPITEALCGDTVKFHVAMQNTSEGDEVFMTLYDDDTRVKPLEDHKDDEIKLVYSTNGKPVISEKVYGNKIVRQIVLDNFEELLKDEEDKELELFFKCKHQNEEVDLPHNPEAYLKLKGMPKIVLVNGHWNRVAHKLGMSPGAGGEEYWKFFTGNVKRYKDAADSYFGISSKDPVFIDGSSLWGGSESGSERKERGYAYAKEHFKEIIKGLGTEKIYLISHSEGGACAAGVAKYLMENGINVGESLMLSADEGDEFSVEGNYPCYQIVAGYISKTFIAGKSVFNIDPVVMDNMVKGVTRYGVYISGSGLTTVHGATIDASVFGLVNKLKNINVIEAWNSEGNIVRQTSPLDEDWYRIDENILYNKRIDFYPQTNTNFGEVYKTRQD